MSTLSTLITELSPQKRQFLALQLKKRGNRLNSFPLSFAQQRLWFVEEFEPGTATYHIPAALRLSGQLDINALEQSFREIVKRHEAVRTIFTTVDGEPVQIITAPRPLTLSVTDLRQLPPLERDVETKRLVAEEVQRPFDLRQGPLLRATLLRLDKDEHVLVVVLHHIISDGWSMGVLMNEMTVLYNAFSAGRPSPLTPLPILFVVFVVCFWQRFFCVLLLVFL